MLINGDDILKTLSDTIFFLEDLVYEEIHKLSNKLKSNT